MTAAPQLPRHASRPPVIPESRERIDRLAGASRAVPAVVALQGPGGSGKTVLLAQLAAAHERSGRRVVDAAAAGDLDRPDGGAEIVVLADDAHRLGREAIAGLRRLLARPGVRLVLAYRPWPRPEPLRELLEAAGGDRHVVVLGHADAATVLAWARARLDDPPPDALIDLVVAQTGGLPALVHPFLEALTAEGGSWPAGRRPVLVTPGRPAAPPVPRPVLDLVRTEVAALDDDLRALLHAVAAGAPVDAELTAELLDLSPGESAELIRRARAGGSLLPSGELIPLVRTALLQAVPADLTRAVRRRLLGLLLERGEDPLETARALAAEGVRDPRAARVLSASGTAALATDPALAGTLMGEAVACGAPVAGLAVRRAEAAALAGDAGTALQLADTVLADEDAPDRPRAAAVTAAVLARRGLLDRSAELYRAAGPERAGAAALALLATGQPAAATAVLESGAEPASAGRATSLAGSEELMARGVLQSLGSSPGACGDIAAALSTLTRAATLLEPVGRTALVMDSPAALAALVALHSGELAIAGSVLRRAIDTELGGSPARPRHLLLLAWVEMLRGRGAPARELIDAARAAARDGLEPRDELFHRALEVGLARRASDVPALVAAWVRAREAVLRHPVDLFALLPLGELIVAAARLEDTDRLAPHVAAAQALLTRLGEPPLWAAALHWSGVQAAILADDPEALRPHAAALVEASRTSPYAATLARAGRGWLRVLTGDVDPASVVSAAEELAAVGLAWDGSRLAGQAAVRASDPRARTELLGCARALAEAHGLDQGGGERSSPAAERSPAAPAGGFLSEREREVARLVLAGRTYREIGGQLYISAKTVEHHMSRIRQRLGAGNRSDLLDRLRAELAAGA